MSTHSFAVMAYKDSPFLADCLASLKKQTVQSEIFITTSTPSPYIESIAKQFDVPVYSTINGRGIGHDWNFSFTTANTDYVTLAHQDDIYTPDYAATCLKAAGKYKDMLICFTDYIEIAGDVERKNTKLLIVKRIMIRMFMLWSNTIKNRFWKKLSLSFGCPIPCPSVTFNKKELSSFRFAEDLAINLDWDAWLQMADMNGRFVYIPYYLSKHRIHRGSATTEGIKDNVRQKEDLEIFNRLWPSFIAKLLAHFYVSSYASNDLK